MSKKSTDGMPFFLASHFALSADEKHLWEVVARKVKPLPCREGRTTLFLQRKGAEFRKKQKTRIVFLDNSGKIQIKPKEPPQRALPVLDLHGFTVQEAFCAFRSFMELAKLKDWKEIEIITGLGSSGKGIIRRELRHWLERKEFSSRITAICHPPNNLGALRIQFVSKRKM